MDSILLPFQRRLKAPSTPSSADLTSGPVSPASLENDRQCHFIAEQPQLPSHYNDVPIPETHSMSKSPMLRPRQLRGEIVERQSMTGGRSLMLIAQIPDSSIHPRNHSRLRASAPRFLHPRKNISERNRLPVHRRARPHWDCLVPLDQLAPPPRASTSHGWRMLFASVGARWPRHRTRSSASRSSSQA